MKHLLLLAFGLAACAYGDPGDNLEDMVDHRHPSHRNRPDFGYLPSPHEGVGRIVHPSPQAKSTRFGNRMVIEGAPGGIDFGKFNPTQLLQADLDELDSEELYKQGSWVLTLQSTVDYGTPAENTFPIAPLVAEILIGSGGAAVTFEVNIVPSCVIAVPSGSVRVKLKWDDVPVNPAQQYVPPETVVVAGFIQRSTDETNAHRWFLTQVDNDNPIVTTGVIPSFAKNVMAYGPSTNAFWSNASAGISLFSGTTTTGVTYVNLTGPELRLLLEAGSLLPMPGAASFWQVQNVAASPNPMIIDFQIDL